MVTVCWVPFLALMVQVDPFSAVIWPMSPWAWPALAGAAAAGAVVVGVTPGAVDPPEQAATAIAIEAPSTPIATVVPVRR
jgi:hypothetical protein